MLYGEVFPGGSPSLYYYSNPYRRIKNVPSRRPEPQADSDLSRRCASGGSRSGGLGDRGIASSPPGTRARSRLQVPGVPVSGHCFGDLGGAEFHALSAYT